MKHGRWVLFLVAFIAAFAANGQQAAPRRITPDLETEMRRAGEDAYIRIIIRMQAQLTEADRRKVLAQRGKDGRKALVRALRDYAASAQQGVRADLEKLASAKLVRNVKPLWLSNVIGAEAQPAAIRALAERQDIEYLKQDIKRPAFQATAWGVSQINADDVWTLLPTAYNGSGVLVAILDTGIDLTHSDLQGRLWINTAEDANGDGQFTAADNNGIDDDGNGFVDDVVGWDFGGNDNDPDDWHGHGSHVAGTVAGDGTGGTQTGVAPGARLMALSYSATLVAGQTESWQGMQYALDMGADIVSFSSGWKDSWAPDYVTWRQNSETLIDAGVLFVVAAGNDQPHDPAPGDVLTPARVPRAVAVGATDNTDTIATFSGNGPTSWQSVAGYNDYIWPPGLLKPDVSAPGVAVLSCENNGAYINGPVWSGTSMATPHASGLAALLLEKDPSLLPHELAYIIRETAVDLGTAGPDNVYGHGRINALDAVNLAYPGAGGYDLSITGTTDVWTSTDIWVDNNDDGVPDDPVRNTTNHLYARLRNIGGRAAGNVEVKFYFADVGTIGISGFDPNNDGDPADGNFMYIASYRVPVIGPVGSSQDEVIAVVPWFVPPPTGDHWCVGVGMVAPNPPNAAEGNTINNRAFRNFFNILLALGAAQAFEFHVYPDPRRPFEPFDLVFERRGLPAGLDIDLQVDRRLAREWFQKVEGFRPVEHPKLKNMPADEDLALQGAVAEDAIRLTGATGRLAGIVAPGGKPVRVRLVLRAPKRMPKAAKDTAKRRPDPLLIIETRRGNEAVGGMALQVKLESPGKAKPKMKVGAK